MSTVIKTTAPGRIRDGMSFSFEDMAARAQEYLDEVRAKAAEIVAQAEKDAATIRSRAEAQGKQAAIRAVERVLEEKVDKQVASLMPALRQTLDEIRQARQTWLDHWEKTAVHVACAIAAKLIRRELSRQPDITLALVRESLELAAGSAEVRVRLNADDHATLAKRAEMLVAEFSREGSAEVVADPQISRGGCRVDTRFGSIDQQFETQLSRIEEELS